jgi:light-regulated signal transduction histidine kinase (bacteriophytochrome)
LNLSEIPLDRLVQEVADLAAPQAAAAGIEITVSQQTDDARLNVDVDLVKQALLNIVMNAIEAMKGGGQLTLISSVREDQAEIRINDTGPGIPEQVRDKIFSLYFTTKAGGSGIGLAMTYRIVQLHDGSVDFVSEPGIGRPRHPRRPAPSRCRFRRRRRVCPPRNRSRRRPWNPPNHPAPPRLPRNPKLRNPRAKLAPCRLPT